MNLINYIYLSILLFTIGAATVLVRRNAIIILSLIHISEPTRPY